MFLWHLAERCDTIATNRVKTLGILSLPPTKGVTPLEPDMQNHIPSSAGYKSHKDKFLFLQYRVEEVLEVKLQRSCSKA